MKLVILVICFTVEFYLNHRIMNERYLWLEQYSALINRLLAALPMRDFPFKGLMLFVLPALLIMLVCKILLSGLLGGVGDFLLSLLVLMACLGPKPVFYPTYDNDMPLAERVCDYSKSLLVSWYAPVFWFLLLGVWGALVYRLVEQYAAQEQGLTVRILRALNWAPERLMALLFLIVGQFQPGSALWIAHLVDYSLEKEGFIAQLVPMALGRESIETVDFESLEGMVYHANLALLTLVALFSLASLF